MSPSPIAPQDQKLKSGNTILLVRGQGIGPECIEATLRVLAATGIPMNTIEGSLGYPDAAQLFPLLNSHAPEVYASQFGTEDAGAVAARMEKEARQEAQAGGDINDFYKKLLSKLQPEVLRAIKTLVADLEKQTLLDAARASAVLKGALRTLDEGDEPSRNVTIRKAFEQYANIRRCVTLDPIAPGIPGADILFVRENVEDLYASIEHRLGRNYPQALRHQTPEGCELICRAAFEAALRDGRKKVTALEKPNILKITGGLFKESFLKVAKDYSADMLGERGIQANFMIIDDGLAAIAAAPQTFDVVVTTNMFGDIGSDIAAKVTGGVGLVSSNNTNPNNPNAVSMFETMGGTADDIAGQNKANPVALIDAAAEMLLHIGGNENILAAELIKTAVLGVLAEGWYVGDIRRGPYQEARGKEKLGTREFADKIVSNIARLKELKTAHPSQTIKQIAVNRADPEVKPLFVRVLRSYEQFARDMETGSSSWKSHLCRNIPPNPVRAQSKVIGFDLFVDDSGMKVRFAPDGTVDEAGTEIDPFVAAEFESVSEIDIKTLFDEGKAGSIQSVRSFGQYAARMLSAHMEADPQAGKLSLGDALSHLETGSAFAARFSTQLLQTRLQDAVEKLTSFDRASIQLVQAFYRVRAAELAPILKARGFHLTRITSRGTEIYPTMCDFEKRDVDRFRVEIDPTGPLAGSGCGATQIMSAVAAALGDIAAKGWVISEMMLNRSFTDGEGPRTGCEISGVSVPYAKSLGSDYSRDYGL